MAVGIRVLQIGVVAAVTLVMIALPMGAGACGCGAFVAPDGYDVAVNREVVALSWDGQHQRVIMALDALSETGDAALLIPTPSPAEVDLAEMELFDELEEVIAPRVVTDRRWWPGWRLTWEELDGAVGGAPGQDPVTVLDQVDLGPLEVTTLDADDADALAAWLDEHDYVMDGGLADAAQPYVDEGWSYVAVRLSPTNGEFDGDLEPLDLRFASEQMVYPMRFSSLADHSQFVRTYVFADQRMQRTDPTTDGTAPDTRFAGMVDTGDAENAVLAELAGDAPYLTTIDQHFHEPSEQVVSDFHFAPDPDGEDYQETDYRRVEVTVLGIAGGPAILIGVVLAGAVAVPLLRRRKPSD